jgi:hypothetical protein
MAVIALHIPGHSTHALSAEILVVIVLLAALGAAGYFIGREYVNIGRRGPKGEQSLLLWFMLGLMVLGVLALVGHNWN